MNQTINAIRSAVKGKSPIVAIPVEGHAPFCIRTKLLKGALKGVDIQTARVEMRAEEEIVTLKKELYGSHYVQPEGPAKMVIHKSFALRITGMDGRVKTSCLIKPVDRRTALKEISAWAEKERVKRRTKKVLEKLTELKAWAAYFDTHIDGEDAREVEVKSVGGGMGKVKALPVSLKSWPERKFYAHRDVETESLWTISESITGCRVIPYQPTILKALKEAEVACSDPVNKANGEKVIALVMEGIGGRVLSGRI